MAWGEGRRGEPDPALAKSFLGIVSLAAPHNQ
jgi:hypothetical protein